MKTLSPTCLKCRGADFELRVLRDEAVAAARCVGCSAEYLLLDSKDYWYDVIQRGYPRPTRCSCKSGSFRLRIDYNVREDGDIDYVEVHSICSACGRTRRQFFFEVDYSGTDHLFKKPLVPCKNPKVLYDLKDINLHVRLLDVFHVVDHLAEKSRCTFLSCVRTGDRWTLVWQDAEGAKATVEKEKCRFIYAMPRRIEVPETGVDTVKKESAFWKRSEVVRIGSMSHVCAHQFRGSVSIVYCSDPPTHPSYTELGLAFEIEFSNEFVRGERIVSKSEELRKVTAGLLAMLAGEFVSWRAPHCFDNPDVHLEVFGERFRKRTEAKGKR